MPRESILLGGGPKKKKEVVPIEKAPVPELAKPKLAEEESVVAPEQAGEMSREDEIDYLNKNIEFIKLAEMAKTMRDNVAGGIGVPPDASLLSRIKKRYLKLKNEISEVDWDLPTGSEYKDTHTLDWFINRLKEMGVEPTTKDAAVFRVGGRTKKTEVSPESQQPEPVVEVIPATESEAMPNSEALVPTPPVISGEDAPSRNAEVVDLFNEKKFSKEVARAKNFEELFAVLYKYGGIPQPDGKGFVFPAGLISTIEEMRRLFAEKRRIMENWHNWLPNVGGLTEKVFDLLEKERPIDVEPEPVVPPIPNVEKPEPAEEVEAPESEPEPEPEIPPIPPTAEPAGPTFNVHNVTVEGSRCFWKSKREKKTEPARGEKPPTGQLDAWREFWKSRDGKEPMGKRFKSFVKDKYLDYKEKGKKVWAPTKERLLGVATFGWWDFHQAEKFRVGTKKTGEEMEKLAKEIQQTENLDFQAAYDEAYEMQTTAELLGRDLNPDEYEDISEAITKKKERVNVAWSEEVIKQTKSELVKRLETNSKFMSYRTARTGEKVITDEKMSALENDLRARLSKMGNGLAREQKKDFITETRKTLDDKWKRRYVYGGVELALAATGWYYLSKLASDAVMAKIYTSAKVGEGVGQGGATAVEGVRQALSTEMHNNVWTTIKELASQNGVNLDNTAIQEFTKQTIDLNHVYEQEWLNRTADGFLNSRTLPAGMKLQLPLTFLRAIGLAL